MNKNFKKYMLWALAVLGLAGVVLAIYLYRTTLKPNVNKSTELYIKTGTDFNELNTQLYKDSILINPKSFILTAKLKRFNSGVKPGRYILDRKMNNNDLINRIRSGNQDPVSVTFNNIRTLNELAGKISKQIEADSVSILSYLENEDNISEKGFTKKTVLTAFMPDSYEMYWNTSAEEFFDRMTKEYSSFWTDKRKAKADSIGLSLKEISVLASIVQAEQSKYNDEKPTIAGLYINRLKKNIALQSDPTLIYATGDFSKKRVLIKDKEIDSPYNTYMYRGLPPGPINLPEKSSVKAVLNYKKHNYYYMCAKEDFSGYHYFSNSLSKHEYYARKYRVALNKRKIYK